MIKITIKKNNNDIVYVKTKGHADPIICSSISALMYAVADKLLIDKKEIKVNIDESGIFEIDIKKSDAEIQYLLKMLENSFYKIELDNKKEIKIIK